MLQNTLYTKTITTPVGKLRLVASGKGLCAVLFRDGEGSRLTFDGAVEAGDTHPILQKTERQLQEYFAGKRQTFDVALDMRGTVFQLMAWKELQNIPYGATRSYAEQARGVGDVKKARAVGMANGRNPVAIIVPCHRVIGANGALTGFGGGLPVKEFLLEHERVCLMKKAG